MSGPRCYLLHLDPPLAHARHYAGIALDGNVPRRVREHITGHGSPLIAAAVAAGCQVRVVLDVPGDRGLERRWHNAHGMASSVPRLEIAPPKRRQLRDPQAAGVQQPQERLVALARLQGEDAVDLGL